MIYRIIDFFHFERLFGFSKIREYLKNNIDEWLMSVPLVTLRNPDLYYCGLYLSKSLNVEIDEEKVKNFLLEVYSEIIDEFLKGSGLSRKLKKSRIINHWEELMGKAIANRTTSIYIKNKTLFVTLNSSVVKNELMMMRQQIIDALNKHAGEKIIEKIVIK